MTHSLQLCTFVGNIQLKPQYILIGQDRKLVPVSATEPKAEGCNREGRSYQLLSTSSSWTSTDLFYGAFAHSFITFLLLSLLFPFISLSLHFFPSNFLSQIITFITLVFFIFLHEHLWLQIPPHSHGTPLNKDQFHCNPQDFICGNSIAIYSKIFYNFCYPFSTIYF